MMYIDAYRTSGVYPLDSLSYDKYCQGLEGGPTLDYWWKLNTNFGSGNGINVGDAGTMALVLRGTKTGATYNQATVTLRTDDNASLKTTENAFMWLNASTLLVDGTAPFTAGGWFNVPSVTDGQLLFRSNMGGTEGYWRGIDVLHQSGADYLTVVLGTNSASGGKFFYRLNTPSGSFPLNSNNFFALYVSASGSSTTPANITLKMYINGALKTLTYSTGTGDTVAFPITASSPDSYNGIAYGAAGDTYGGKMSGYYDEVFFHWAELTAVEIAEMYRRGATPL